ncbi:TBC1 domain family member 20 isoform X1 [Scophthalmus maximus]|uniref:TBC1 domain family member 20 isoform X1 n=1 Tax=Scophthalmus maximus TaxID=52904 RepID=UPI0015E0F444|nr:TBC1 domain family member 20 isoform X1 [Scophthalmus maximus]
MLFHSTQRSIQSNFGILRPGVQAEEEECGHRAGPGRQSGGCSRSEEDGHQRGGAADGRDTLSCVASPSQRAPASPGPGASSADGDMSCTETVERENNKDYNQVLLDVQRSLRRFPPGMPDEQREGLQEELIDIILRVLKRNSQLHYYQGYHDIVVTFLLVLGERLATALVEKLSTHHLRDFMDPTMDNTKHILNYLMPIIERVNPEVHDFMQQAEVGTVFALSWLITWFGHVLSDFRHVVRLYDFFLACHPLMPIYFAAVIVLYREEEVLECECDMAMVHHLLSQIPQDLPYETLISRAGDLFVQFPPSELAKEAASHDSMATSTFKDFDLASTQQRPDSVLRRRRRQRQAALESAAASSVVTVARPSAARRFVRLAVMGLTVALGAAALAVVNSALEWAPKLDLFP